MFARMIKMRNVVPLVAAGVVAGMMACASPNATEDPEGSDDMLSALEVTSGGESTLVTLVGVRAADLEVASHSDPWAISIDLGDVPTGSEMMPLAVYDGTVDQVSAASFTDDDGVTRTRVEIALSVAATHEIVPSEKGITLRVVPGPDGMMGEAGEDELDVWDTEADPFAANGEELPDTVALALEPPPEATELSDVTVEAVEGGVLVHLVADGVIGATESFQLDDPARLVLDLPGLSSSMKQGRVAVGSATVESVRVGAHSDKVRVVMDGGSAGDVFAGKRIMPATDGLFVAVGSGEILEDALVAAMDASDDAWAAKAAPVSVGEAEGTDWMEPLADADIEAEMDGAEEPTWTIDIAEDSEGSEEPDDTEPQDEEAFDAAPVAMIADAGEPAAEPETVFGIEYETDLEAGVERIAIVTSGVTEPDWIATDAETVMIRIPNAQMSEAAQGKLATRAGGPISMIRAFEQPGVEPSEVRIIVKREPHLVPRLDLVGSNVFVEFPISETPVPAAPAADSLAGVEAGESLETAMQLDPAEPRMPTAPAAPAADDSLTAVDQVAVAEPIPMVPPPPASLEPPAAIDVLQEGGLIDGKEYRGRRISLDFKDVAIADVLRLIAEVSDLNIISGDEVKGLVSIRLVDVPWDQALDVILLTKGLGFVRVGNVLRIAPSDVLAQEEEVRLQERRAKEKLEDLVVKLIPVNYGDIKSMEGLVKRLLTSRGSVNTDERTSTLIIKDISSVIDEATALVAAVDTETPQVMIEAKIVEANLDFARELGSVWTVGQQQLVDGFDPASGTRRDLGGQDFRFSPSNFRDLSQANNVSFMNSLTAQPTALFNLSAFLLDEKFNIDVQLQAAENTGNGKVVSSPRIVTLDNSEATVEQGVSIPFQTFENGDAKLEFVDATLSLKVTPHITADKAIIMEIEVTRDAPDSTVQTATGSPAIAKNQAKTEALVKDGQTLVLGGIYTIEKTFRQSRVPYLHRIPIIGVAFKSKEVSDARKELLIFVTPRVVLQPNQAS